MSFYYKVYERGDGIMLAVCDKDICGKKLKEKDVEIHVNPHFYKDKEGSEEDVSRFLRACFSANLIGTNSVQLGIKLGLVDPKQVKNFDGIPHAHYIAMKI